MRLNKLFAWFLCCGVAALVAATSAGAQDKARVPGHIVAAKVTGTVTATNTTDKKTTELKTNDILFQNYVVNTGANSSVILVFSNGATLNIGAESTLSIDEYLQDPLEKELALSDLTEEPNSSVTKLNLTRGELVGNVKHLHEDRGSSFTVNTPVGAAGIRGTTFRIVFHPDSTGKIFFTLSTAEGKVLLSGEASKEIASVSTGKEVVINVDATVDTTTNTVTVTKPTQPTATTDIPAATQATITAAAQQIIDVSSKLIISTTNQATADAAAAKAAADAAAAKAAADKAAADAAAAKDAQEKADKEAAAKKAQEAADKAAADAAAAAAKAAAAKQQADADAAAALQQLQQNQPPSTVPSNNTPTTQSDPLAGGSGN